MKMSLEWHKESLKNTKLSLERKKKQLEDLQIEVARDVQRMTFYNAQVYEAVRQDKDCFDSDKFLKNVKATFIDESKLPKRIRYV